MPNSSFSGCVADFRITCRPPIEADWTHATAAAHTEGDPYKGSKLWNNFPAEIKNIAYS